MSGLNVCVLGAGVVGLNTALALQNEFRNATVTVLADKFYKDTTSYVATGLFLPSASFMGPTAEITKEWVNDSYYFWNDLLSSNDSSKVGIMESSGYAYSAIDASLVENHHIEKLSPVYRRATEDELNLCPGDWKYGMFFSTLLIENGLFLPWATDKFLSGNGEIVTRKIEKISEIAGKYDVVVNCTGLGAKVLCEDDKVVPVRGQLLKVSAPFVDKFYMDDADTYVIPGFEGVTLGGTRNYESYNLNWKKYDELDIKERCESLVPELKGCPVVAKRVGLRPHRCPVRIESELLNALKVVHNYGHGGSGVTTAPGTAKYAVKLVREMLLKSGN